MTINDDFTTGPGFVARARKALVAGVGAAAASFGPALAIAGADGVISFAGEIVPIGVVALTLGAAAALAVYATPNAR
ncbi:hypothetical protein AB0230_01770 [Microbacterium sp. NPDC089190]|uniref:hypothetical protein n=1 Tax=Microbacterium sp. NPDC089190 TaxID=3155063 RepID=UPI00344BA7CB